MLAWLLDKYFIKKPRLRRLVTKALWGDRDEMVNIMGTRLCANSVKENGYHRAQRLVATSSLWRDEAPVLLSLAALLRDGDTFVDAGANVGLYCTALARRTAGLLDVRFHAYEANPDTYRRLLESTRGLDIAAHNLALSDHSGELQFVEGAVSHVFTTRENASAYNFVGHITSVRCERLDRQLISESSIVLKIDVEGQEMEVLEGARALFDSRRVRVVYCDGFKSNKVRTFLLEYGFRLLDGRTMAEAGPDVFSLLATNPAP
jgi:FkbM family methyltransferase